MGLKTKPVMSNTNLGWHTYLHFTTRALAAVRLVISIPSVQAPCRRLGVNISLLNMPHADMPTPIDVCLSDT